MCVNRSRRSTVILNLSKTLIVCPAEKTVVIVAVDHSAENLLRYMHIWGFVLNAKQIISQKRAPKQVEIHAKHLISKNIS